MAKKKSAKKKSTKKKSAKKSPTTPKRVTAATQAAIAPAEEEIPPVMPSETPPVTAAVLAAATGVESGAGETPSPPHQVTATNPAGVIDSAAVLADILARLANIETHIKGVATTSAKASPSAEAAPPGEDANELIAEIARKEQIKVWVVTYADALNIAPLTPALVGRAMRKLNATDRHKGKSPYEVFVLIQEKNHLHVGKTITELLAVYPSDEPPAAKASPSATTTLPRMRRPQTTAYASGKLRNQMNRRMKVLEKCCLAVSEKISRSGIADYLVGDGVEIFVDWPKWSDLTGGKQILEELSKPPDKPSLADSEDGIPTGA